MTKFMAAVMMILLVSCAAPGPQQPKFDPALLLDQLSQLPGAQILDRDNIVFSYPNSELFAPEAVLPLPGGTRLLDPLSDFFQTHKTLTWRVDVRAETARDKGYDQLLAEKRAELLKNYLQNKGLNSAGFTFYPAAEKGHPLIFSLNLPQTAEKP